MGENLLLGCHPPSSIVSLRSRRWLQCLFVTFPSLIFLISSSYLTADMAKSERLNIFFRMNETALTTHSIADDTLKLWYLSAPISQDIGASGLSVDLCKTHFCRKPSCHSQRRDRAWSMLITPHYPTLWVLKQFWTILGISRSTMGGVTTRAFCRIESSSCRRWVLG